MGLVLANGMWLDDVQFFFFFYELTEMSMALL
jgi:hypothetical protein